MLGSQNDIFRHQKTWEITPDKKSQKPADTAFGRGHDAADSRAVPWHAIRSLSPQRNFSPGATVLRRRSASRVTERARHTSSRRAKKLFQLHMERLGKLRSTDLKCAMWGLAPYS